MPQEAAYGDASAPPPPPAAARYGPLPAGTGADAGAGTPAPEYAASGEETPLFAIGPPTPGYDASADPDGDARASGGADGGSVPDGSGADGSLLGGSVPDGSGGADALGDGRPGGDPGGTGTSTTYSFGPPSDEAAGTAAPKRSALRRRGVAVVVAAALAAGLLGGVAGGWVGGGFDDDSSSSSYTATGSAPVQSVADKSLTGVAAVARAVTPSVVEIGVKTRRGTSGGSGIVLSADGKILTNAHVVDGADGGTITVTFSDGRTAEAKVLGTDTASDLAILKVDGVDNLKPATLGDSDSVAVGDPVVAIGSPEGLTNTVTSGIVSALDREVTVPSADSGQDSRLPFGGTYDSTAQSEGTTYHAIQTDASINPGNSGGPLLDMSGRVIGINSAIYSPTSGSLGGDAGSVGLGFAIPVNQVKALLGDLESGAKA